MQKKSLNLMPKHYQAFSKRVRFAYLWVGIWLVCGFWFSVEGYKQWRESQKLQHNVAAKEQEFQFVKRLQTKVVDFRVKSELLNRMSTTADYLDVRHPFLTLLSTVSQATKSSDQVSIQNLSLTTTDSSNTAESHELVIKGVAVDSLAIAKFANNLKRSNRFESVTLSPSKPINVNGHSAFAYSLKCNY